MQIESEGQVEYALMEWERKGKKKQNE